MTDGSPSPDIVLVEGPLDPAELRRLVTSRFEYTALINIRPAQGNRSMLIEDEAVRTKVREITHWLIGRGEPLE
jgi:hypothetical protein